MSSLLSKRLQDPAALFSACQASLPSWSGASLDSFSCEKLSGGHSSPGLYLVSSTAEGVTPARAVVKLDIESEEHPFYQFYQVLSTNGGPYQARVARQLGEAGLGPEMFHVVEDRADKNWGLMIMEELPDGGFEEDFSSSNVTTDDMRAMGFLFGKIHLLPTNEVCKAAELTKKLVLDEGIVDRKVVEELYQTRGGYIIFLFLWWKKYFPAWMAKNSPRNHPLPPAYVERFFNIILKVGRIKPLTKVFGRLGFSHTDAWHGNLMRKGDKIVAIDCETASIGPAFLDLGGIVSSGSLPHIDRELREALILSFYEAIGEECCDMEAALYDLELASMHRHLWGVLCVQFGLVGAPLEDVEKIGSLFFEKGEAMVSGMERAVDDDKLMKNIVDHGIFWSIREELSEGREEAIRKHFEGK